MTQEQIREIVKMTVDELDHRQLLRDPYQNILKTIDKKLDDFFNDKGDGNGISYGLRHLSDDTYIDIIYLQYRDGKTLEWIAEYFEVDVSTIKRNKKRLIYKLYDLIRDF